MALLFSNYHSTNRVSVIKVTRIRLNGAVLRITITHKSFAIFMPKNKKTIKRR